MKELWICGHVDDICDDTICNHKIPHEKEDDDFYCNCIGVDCSFKKIDRCDCVPYTESYKVDDVPEELFTI